MAPWQRTRKNRLKTTKAVTATWRLASSAPGRSNRCGQKRLPRSSSHEDPARTRRGGTGARRRGSHAARARRARVDYRGSGRRRRGPRGRRVLPVRAPRPRRGRGPERRLDLDPVSAVTRATRLEIGAAQRACNITFASPTTASGPPPLLPLLVLKVGALFFATSAGVEPYMRCGCNDARPERNRSDARRRDTARVPRPSTQPKGTEP